MESSTILVRLGVPLMMIAIAMLPQPVTAAAITSSASDTSSGAAGMYCPTVPSSTVVHARCHMTTHFLGTSCQTVREEIHGRIVASFSASRRSSNGDDTNRSTTTWIDPHNHGTYALVKESTDSNTLLASRTTGDGLYVDEMKFTFDKQNDNGKESCLVHACSVSQVNSIFDYGTNYCNLRNLYCGVEDGCPILYHDFIDATTSGSSSNNASLSSYKELYNDCWQRKPKRCLSSTKKATKSDSTPEASTK